MQSPVRIVIVGGGYVGMYTALGLQKKLSRGRAEITIIDPQANMTYQPFLPEAAAGSVEPRHVVVPAAARAQALPGDHRGRVGHLARRPDRQRQAGRGRGLRPRLRPARRLPRLGVAPAADPRAGRAGHRVQDDRRGDLPAQPRAGPARPGELDQRPGPAYARAVVHVRRRWLRRCRGDGRARGHGALRDPLLRHDRAVGHALGAGRGGRPDHARGVGVARVVHRRPARRAQDRRAAEHDGRSRSRAGTSCCPTAPSSIPRPSSGRRA